MTITEDLDTYLEDFGLAVSFGVGSYVGILDMPDQVMGDGLAISTEYSLLIKVADIASASSGDNITVDGVSYKVREYRKIDDGKFARIILTKT